MRNTSSNRRDFFVETARVAGAALLALQMPWLAGCAADAPPFAGFTPVERRTMRTVAAQILPSAPGVAGADDADATAFIERALATPFFAGSAPLIRTGLAQLDARAQRTPGGGGGFAALPGDVQVAQLREIEKGEFFLTARRLVLIGTFADPSYGGNRDMVGWTMIGIDHRPAYAAPYGYYDDQAMRASAAGTA